MKRPTDTAEVERQIQRLVELRHSDPHGVLGVHPDGDGVVVRAYRPDAERVTVLPDFGGQIPARHRKGGVFEARLNGRNDVFGYLLKVDYRGGASFTLRDSYSFPPTLGELDSHLVSEGRHERIWERLGAHPRHHQGVFGTSFAVWAPTARSVSVVGDFNSWDGRLHQMRSMGSTGVWELFVPDVGAGARYKFEIRPGGGGTQVLKADPYAFRTEVPPATASVIHQLDRYLWRDEQWMERRGKQDVFRRPMAVYEVHLSSWRRVVEEGSRSLTWKEAAAQLGDYVKGMGFTHVEFLPLAEHPFGGSWGYQVSGYFAPTARHGHPDEFKALVDELHQRGIGVILDWVPAHFPKDAHALARFDGSALYEHEDPRLGAHPDWGTLVFNYGRNEVRNFLLASALFWLDQYHIDGLRVDAVASMLYRDYSRKPGEWIPNRFGGRENEEAIAFLKEVNERVRDLHPGAVMIAEESTAFPKVTHLARDGGLSFHYKWSLGWMHDTLDYFAKDPVHRKWHHNGLTFGLMYIFSEQFFLPLSHDEVVHGKGSLLQRMSGDDWQRFANLRALFAWMWAHPGKKLLFMGGEFAQRSEWNHDVSLDWHLLGSGMHAGVSALVRDLNGALRDEPALYELDGDGRGFQWLQADAADANVFAFVRWSEDRKRHAICVANLSPVPRYGYRVGMPQAGSYKELINSDAAAYGGSGVGNPERVAVEDTPWDGQQQSAQLTLPPLGTIWLVPGKE
ncbi:MAG: 1,4-alpha-glucan branching enzyme [Deltaproteobacteria bacterium 13_1_40CM_3_69_14]|nr:MAG: 1,4-alpha-glucan branching enzyme [Deltaproteobacteria bacterium 13_1_40CM_3_69_14]